MGSHTERDGPTMPSARRILEIGEVCPPSARPRRSFSILSSTGIPVQYAGDPAIPVPDQKPTVVRLQIQELVLSRGVVVKWPSGSHPIIAL